MFKTPVSILQELTVQKKLAAPDYQTHGTGQPHCMSFTCSVKAGNEKAVGVGATKKDAKHDAAKNILKKFGISNLDHGSQVSPLCVLPAKSSKIDVPTINYIGKLNEFCSGHRYPQPTYTDDVIIQNGQFCVICTFNTFTAKGYGYNKKDAKQDSAKKMLELIKECDLENNTVIPVEKFDINSEVSQEVIKKYTDLFKNININDKEECGNNNVETIKLDEVEGDEIITWEELLEDFNKHGYKYEISTFQAFPLILSLKINDHVLMNCGKSRDEILRKLVISFVDMRKRGIDFSKPLLDI